MAVGNFEGARVNFPDGGVGAVAFSKNTNAYVGTTEALLENPGDAKLLCIHVESGNMQIRPGDYTALGPFNCTSDVDATQETIVITDVEDRMSSVDGTDILVYGPVQLSLASGALVGGLSVDTSYWVAKPLDAGVATDEVAFYLTEAAAKAASTGPSADSRIALTTAVGTANFAGMSNNALGATPAATTTDGYSAATLGTGLHCISAPDQLSVIGITACVATYWWQL